MVFRWMLPNAVLWLMIVSLFLSILYTKSMVERCRVKRDLWIIFYPALFFNCHINNAIEAVFQEFIINNIKFFHNIFVLVSLFCSFIRSKLEYGELTFYSLYEQQITTTETVQKKFLQYVPLLQIWGCISMWRCWSNYLFCKSLTFNHFKSAELDYQFVF